MYNISGIVPIPMLAKGEIKMIYNKPQIIAQNDSVGAYAAGCGTRCANYVCHY